VAGANNGNGIWVAEINSSGAVQYTTTLGTGSFFPDRIAIDGSDNVYVTGISQGSGDTLPTSANAYKSSITATNNAFLVKVAAGGASTPYATWFGGTDTNNSGGLGLAVETISSVTYAYVGGYTYSSTFPTTAGAYDTTFSGTPGSNYNGFVAQFNPTAATGPASLVYSTFLGIGNTEVFGVAADPSGNTYAVSNCTVAACSTSLVTSGAFQYTGYDTGSGGIFVTKLNPAGSAVVYSAYLGYSNPTYWASIAVDQTTSTSPAPSAYVTGAVGYADWPTTAGAYQTTYAGGFVTKLSGDGATELYSTFLGGPSSYGGGSSVVPWSIVLPNGCTSNCTAWVAGYTNTSDFPTTANAVQTTASTSGSSAFVVQLAANGQSALFSSYLSGIAGGLQNGWISSPYYGLTPSAAVDSSGNVSVVGNLSGTQDFPVTISNANQAYPFLARLANSSSSFLWSTPTSINFGTQPVGVSTSVYQGSATVKIRNISGTATTISSIVVSPASIFSESDGCNGTIPAGGICSLTLNFDPAAPGARTGTVMVTSTASDSPTVINLSGSGADGPFIQGTWSAQPAALTFGNQAVGTVSSAQTITLTNIGDQTAAMTISTGTPSFSQQNNCPSQLIPGNSCTVQVTFNPTQQGLWNDNLQVTNAGPTLNVPLSGTGTVSGGTTTLALSATTLNFATQTVGTTSGVQQFNVTNSGSAPVTITALTFGGTNGSDFAVQNTNCLNSGVNPLQLNPEVSCYIQVNFTPAAAGSRAGTLTVVNSGTNAVVNLTGTGVTAVQTLEFNPGGSMNFPDQPVGFATSPISIYALNEGTSPIIIDRVLVSGDFLINYTNCPTATLNPNPYPGHSQYEGYCQIQVEFKPTTTGARTGTLTLVDNAPNSPQTISLSGNGLTATGTLVLNPAQINFANQATNTTSAVQYVYTYNPGNSPIQVTGYSLSGTNSGDFSLLNFGCGNPPYTLNPGAQCYVGVQFTPTGATNRTGTLNVSSSAGNQPATLNGTGFTANQTIQLTPANTFSFGSVVQGQSTGTGNNFNAIYLTNTGTSPVTFTDDGVLSGGNVTDFTVSNGSCPGSGGQLQPGATCYVYVTMTPGGTGSRSTTLTFTNSAANSPESLTLSGTGVATAANYTTVPNQMSYPATVVGTSTPTSYYVYFYNNTAASVTLGNVSITGNFNTPNDQCSGKTISASGGNCYVYVNFAPPSNASIGLNTGTLKFNDSNNTTLIATALTGDAVAQINSSYLSPGAVNFPTAQVYSSVNQAGTTTAAAQTVYLYNSGNVPLTVGTLPGTGSSNIGAPTANEFSFLSGQGGSNGCGGQTVNPGSTCQMNITFTPNGVNGRSGTLVFPVTYFNSTTANLSLALGGTAVAEKNTFTVSPATGNFVDQAVGVVTPYQVLVTLINTGNRPFNIATLLNSNGAEFSLSGNGAYDQCSSVTVQPGSSCNINATFTPSTTGARSATITYPITYADGTTANAQATLKGNGVSAGKTLQISPGSVQFPVQVVSTQSAAIGIGLKNIGNQTFSIGTDSISLGSSDFTITYDSCTGNGNFGPNATCQINVNFNPSATGNRTGTLTIGDTATGGPHTVSLSGTGITASQAVVISPLSLSFPNQAAGSSSTTQAVFVTNQTDSTIGGFSYALGATNGSDWNLNVNNCSSSLGARSTCFIYVSFTPQAGTAGSSLPDTISVSYSATGSPQTITLTGNSVTAGPAAAVSPSPLVFSTVQNVGTTSAAQNVSVRNTGSANLTLSGAALSGANASEFSISADGCGGATLTPGQTCVIAVKFTPALGGVRQATLSVSDNAANSPQAITVQGTGLGVPAASLSAGLTFANTNIGTTTAAQNVTLTNAGTDVLNISGIALTGANAGDFIITSKTCGTTLAATVTSPHPTCTVSVAFKPTAAGSRGASLTFTDNAGNVSGATQNASLSGTGVAVPTAALASGTGTCGSGSTASNCNLAAFATTNIGSTNGPVTVTLTNSGTGPLTITQPLVFTTGTDFTQVNNCGTTLNNGSSCTISISFAPTAAGTRTDTITISDNANNTASAQTIVLSGTGQSVPNATTATPGTLNFGNQNIGTTSTAQAVTLTNGGTGTLTISGIGITGDFIISTGTNACPTTFPGNLAKGGSCNVYVAFKPTQAGTRTGTLTITDNANNTAGTQQTVALNGNGVGIPTVVLSPGTVTFSGSQGIGTSSASQSVTLTNNGTGVAAVSSISIGGTNAADFSQTNNCPASLAASGGNCTISVTFKPTAAGARTATLIVSDNSNNTSSTQTTTLKGTGVGVPNASTSGALTFNGQAVNTSSYAQNVTLTNNGTGTLLITSISFNGTNPGDFSKTTTCGSSLVVGANCTVSVIFTPKGTGSRSANLVFTDNSGGVAGSTQPVGLSGTGLAASAPTVGSLSPANGSGTSATLSAQYTDSDGVSDLFSVRILISPVASVANACYAYYAPRSNILSLTNDAGTSLTTATLGSNTTLSNSQCALSAAATTVSTTGNTLTVNWAFTSFTFPPGPKNVYLYAVGLTGLSSGQVNSGTFTIPGGGPPTLVSLSPTSGTGTSVTLHATYGDPDGLSDYHTVYLMVNSTTGGANACWVYYYPPTNSLYMRNDAGTAFLGPVTIGTTGATLTNSQCTLDAGASSVTTNGNQLTLNAVLTFSASFTGSKNVYMSVTGFSGQGVPFTLEGTWTP